MICIHCQETVEERDVWSLMDGEVVCFACGSERMEPQPNVPLLNRKSELWWITFDRNSNNETIWRGADPTIRNGLYIGPFATQTEAETYLDHHNAK